VCALTNINLKSHTNENANYSKIFRRFVLQRVSVVAIVGPDRRAWQFKADEKSQFTTADHGNTR
jgi:hypothetical protein